MAWHCVTKDFDGRRPNALLARYCQASGVCEEVNCAAMKETQPDELFAAWLLTPDSKRNEIDTEFRAIFELSCEKGFAAIRNEARWHLIAQQSHSAAYTAFFEGSRRYPILSGGRWVPSSTTTPYLIVRDLPVVMASRKPAVARQMHGTASSDSIQ